MKTVWDKVKAWAKVVWAAVKSSPAVFGYGVVAGALVGAYLW